MLSWRAALLCGSMSGLFSGCVTRPVPEEPTVVVDESAFEPVPEVSTVPIPEPVTWQEAVSADGTYRVSYGFLVDEIPLSDLFAMRVKVVPEDATHSAAPKLRLKCRRRHAGAWSWNEYTAAVPTVARWVFSGRGHDVSYVGALGNLLGYHRTRCHRAHHVGSGVGVVPVFSQVLIFAWAIAAGQPRPEATAEDPAYQLTEPEQKRLLRMSPLPLPPANPTNAVADSPAAAELGHTLFFDPALSGDGTISCSTCHQPELGFGDGKPLAEGMGTTTRHAPTLWNTAYQRWWFWDGRADSLWSQSIQPMESDLEMAGDRVALARMLASQPQYRTAYQAIFGPLPEFLADPNLPPHAKPMPDQSANPRHLAWQALAPEKQSAVNQVVANAGKCLEAYQRKLVSRQSPFDEFVASIREQTSPPKTFPPSAARGLKLFLGDANCILCHSGPNFSDGEFHNIRVPPKDGAVPTDSARYLGIQQLLADPFNSRGPFSDDPDGASGQRLRFLHQKADDWGAYRTPTLRNVALSPPYMHQGQFATLEEVLEYYSTHRGALPPGHHQQDRVFVPLYLDEAELSDLLAFLKTLTDEDIDPRWLQAPGSKTHQSDR